MSMSFTIVVHGATAEAQPLLDKLTAAIRETMPREQARRIAYAFTEIDSPRSQLQQAARELYAAAGDLREAETSLDRVHHGKTLSRSKESTRLDEAVFAMGVALAVGNAPFMPTDKQVLWAMNVAGVQYTSAGHTLEEVIPEAEYAEFVRRIVAAVQNPNADNLYTDEGTLIDAARADGLIGCNYGDVIFEGRPIEDAPPAMLEIALRMIPPGENGALMGFGPTAYRGLQVDYVGNDGKIRSVFQLGIAPHHLTYRPRTETDD